MKNKYGWAVSTFALISGSVLAVNALAHEGAVSGAQLSSNYLVSALQGFAHPFSGLDHLVGLLLVGVLIAMQAKKQAWMTGANSVIAFGLALLAGGMMTASAVVMVELAVLASLVVGLGLVISFNIKGKKRQKISQIAMALTPAVVFAHGLAHGAEAASFVYGVGAMSGAVVLTLMACVAAKIVRSKFTPVKI